MRTIIAMLEKIVCQLLEKNRRLAGIVVRLDRIIELLSPAPAAGFRISLQGAVMKKAADVTVDFTVFENGQATAVLTPVDKDGNATDMPVGASVPVWASSDPGITVSASADGLSALLTAGAVAVQNATVSATATLADASTITGTTDPIDVVAQPPGSAVAFKIALSASA